MFTVLICGNATYESIRENHSHILDMLLKEKNCALCTWDPHATGLAEAVPGLDEVTAGRSEWRAIIVQDGETFGFECVDRRNPFDAVGSADVLNDFNELEILDLLERARMAVDATEREEYEQKADALIAQSAPRIEEFRALKRRNYLTAVRQPLTRLAIWLLGSPMQDAPEVPEHWPAALLSDDCVVNRAYYEWLASIGTLPSELELFKAEQYKYDVLNEYFLPGALVRKKPSAVYVLAERYAKRADDILKFLRYHHEEMEYDNFCDDNLFPGNMRFALYDVAYENDIRNAGDYLGFLSFVYMMSANEIPYGAMQAQRVYHGDARVDERKAKLFFAKYLRKLQLTHKMLSVQLKRMQYTSVGEELSAEEALKLFESDVEVPVEIRSRDDESVFFANHAIGLSKNCPRDEYGYWYDQVTEITKKFIRYLREPRRALKYAVKRDFRNRSVIEDERILKLSEERLEDIEYRLLEEEQQMVETTTIRLFQTKQYTDAIEQADKEVRENIEKRMTFKKTLLTGGIALFAFLFGFLPLLIINWGNADTWGPSLAIFGGSFLLMCVIALVYLFVMRKKLVNRMVHFNKVMRGILDDIQSGLQAFSAYLSHACNVMREFSVFNYLEKPTDVKANVLKKHISDIERRMEGVNNLFSGVLDTEWVADEDIQPYRFDFSRPEDYLYDVPYEEIESTVEFIRKGNHVSAPIDYVRSVSLTREELYD